MINQWSIVLKVITLHLEGKKETNKHSPITVARLVPVDVTLIQDDVLATFDQTQVVRLGAREVVQRHHHLLLFILIIEFILIVIIITLISQGDGRRGPPLLSEEEERQKCLLVLTVIDMLMCVCDCVCLIVCVVSCYLTVSRNRG